MDNSFHNKEISQKGYGFNSVLPSWWYFQEKSDDLDSSLVFQDLEKLFERYKDIK